MKNWCLVDIRCSSPSPHSSPAPHVTWGPAVKGKLSPDGSSQLSPSRAAERGRPHRPGPSAPHEKRPICGGTGQGGRVGWRRGVPGGLLIPATGGQADQQLGRRGRDAESPTRPRRGRNGRLGEKGKLRGRGGEQMEDAAPRLLNTRRSTKGQRQELLRRLRTPCQPHPPPTGRARGTGAAFLSCSFFVYNS